MVVEDKKNFVEPRKEHFADEPPAEPFDDVAIVASVGD